MCTCHTPSSVSDPSCPLPAALALSSELWPAQPLQPHPSRLLDPRQAIQKLSPPQAKKGGKKPELGGR